MNSKTEELLQRTFDFGVDTLKFLMTLPKEKVFGIITYQLGKASTSVGSNYEEAQGAESNRDFNHKIGIVLKEVRESNYWLRVLSEIYSDSKNKDELNRLLNESLELKKIFSAIKIKTQVSSKKK